MQAPKVSGFSFIKNGIRLGYPFLESLRSLAPLCDELVVAHGDSTDGTGEALEALRPLIPCEYRIVNSPWDAANIKGGTELSRQTNVALDHCRHDLCFYIQGDELLHEEDYPVLRADLAKLAQDEAASALVLHWLHFYGNFETVVHNRKWYRREIRAIKKSHGLRSYGDAQGFRIPRGETWIKPLSRISDARIFHYGWVRPPQTMAKKSEELDRLWHGNARDGLHTQENVYPPHLGMRKFSGTHPELMRERVKALEGFDPFRGKKPPGGFKAIKHEAEMILEKLTGWRAGEFRNYRL
jgi:glycosyltransferase involved in cell wall biosynthesis